MYTLNLICPLMYRSTNMNLSLESCTLCMYLAHLSLISKLVPEKLLLLLLQKVKYSFWYRYWSFCYLMWCVSVNPTKSMFCRLNVSKICFSFRESLRPCTLCVANVRVSLEIIDDLISLLSCSILSLKEIKEESEPFFL